MSGLVACFDRDGRGLDRERVGSMLDRIDHRGPDGRGAWRDDRVALGHQHLATTPQAGAVDQPYREDGFVVAADARLDNRDDLLASLPVSADGRPVHDAELLLAAYRTWGERCPERLVGAFAFVVWDGDDGSAFCARDHFGVKPLYYHRTDGTFAVATEPKALFALPSVSRRLDEAAVGEFLTETFEDERTTVFESVRRLPPAHATRVDSGAISTWRYWDLDPDRTVTMASDRAYARRFRELFDRAVRDRLRTDERVGTTLSGGLDSSSITAVADEQLPDDAVLPTFTGAFESVPAADEREYVETLVDRAGIEPHYVFADDLGPLAAVEEAMAVHDRPIHNTAHFLKWAVTERASEAGVGVVLDGAHGDSAVDYGLGLLPQLARTGRWRHLSRELRAMGDVLGRSASGLFLGHVLPWLIPGRLERLGKRALGRPTGVWRANPALDPAFVERTGLSERYRRLAPEGSVLGRSARRWQYRSLTTGSITAFFEANDLTNAAFGVEPRYPFVDRRLIAFSLAVPPTQQLADGWTRSILRRALGDVLPDAIQWRPWKTLLDEGFLAGFRDEHDRIDAALADPGQLERFLDVETLRDHRDEFLAKPNMRDARVLWTATSLATWLDDADVGRDGTPREADQPGFDREKRR